MKYNCLCNSVDAIPRTVLTFLYLVVVLVAHIGTTLKHVTELLFVWPIHLKMEYIKIVP